MSDESSLIQRMDKAFVAAMKARDALRTSTLRMVRAALKNREIEKRGPLDEGEVVQVLSCLVKQRRGSIEQFQAGNRPDLVAKEEAEVAILKEFLPAEMSSEELAALAGPWRRSSRSWRGRTARSTRPAPPRTSTRSPGSRTRTRVWSRM